MTSPADAPRFRVGPVRVNDAVLKRLVACLFGGFVLCLMVGNQEGTQSDFGHSFNKATEPGRLAVFLLVGVAAFFVLTFWPLIRPYLRRPGAVGVGIGTLVSFIGMTMLRWYDPVGKFRAVSKAVSHSHSVPVLVSFFFSPIAWVLLIVGLLLGGATVVAHRSIVGYLTLGYGAVVAVVIFIAHAQLVNFASGDPDHTLGVFFTCAGYLITGVSGYVAIRSTSEEADPRAALDAALSWRPGLPLAGGAILLGLLSFLDAGWFAPLALNAGFHSTSNRFHGTGLASIASMYLSWLGIALFAAGVVLAVVGCYLRLASIGYAAFVVGLGGVILTFVSLDDITKTGARKAIRYGATWQNLGAGGWLACLSFSMLAAAGALAVNGARAARLTEKAGTTHETGQPETSDRVAPNRRGSGSSAVNKTLIPLAIAFVLFYPPTLPINWQTVVVTQIAAYLLLAVGLNVVVGWAGLLDLGYIAFYGIGSYTTAYLTNSLPIKPPHFLHLDPLWAIPFAILACLIAGVLLGIPTLRLRGDYLAIVTLGFGEIMQVVAINAGGVTGGPIGPNVPNPRLHLQEHWGWLPGWLHVDLSVTWGLDSLPYWYLLIALLGIVVILFYRLEGSKLGRAWAAIREDEVAAQATGIKTTKVKLLAFAIGASTSGVAGVFFASQVGYFDPTDFTLQSSILIVAYVVFGGMGSLQGAIAGAAALTWLPYFLQSQVPLPDSQMWIGAVVILMMIFRPAGLIPAKRRQAELDGLDAPASAEVSAVPLGEGL